MLNRRNSKLCACGCGTYIYIDKTNGKMRKFVSGHNLLCLTEDQARLRTMSSLARSWPKSEEQKKKIIELFGNYWHQNDNPKNRVSIFKPYGYSTLVIWENELKNRNRVEFAIHKFNNATPPKPDEEGK